MNTPWLSRASRVRQQVLDATVELVAEVGVERATIEEIANRSGVAKTTIYRHYPSKQVLVVGAVHACTSIPKVSDTGSLREDLISCFAGMTRTSFEGPLGKMMLSLLDAAQRDPELGRLMQAQNVQKRRFAAEVLNRAVERGDLSPDVDIELTVTLLSGPLIYTKLIRREPVTQQLVASVVDSVLAGLQHVPQPTTMQ